MRGISFDLSRKSTGIAYWESGNALRTQTFSLPEAPLGEQLHLWDTHLKALLFAFNPDWLAFEDARAVSKQHGMITFGMLGMLSRRAHLLSLPMVGFAQASVKLELAGSGRAKKPDMIAAAKERWPELEISNDDEADALGVGLCFINRVLNRQEEG